MFKLVLMLALCLALPSLAFHPYALGGSGDQGDDPTCDPIPGQEEQVPGQEDPICDPIPGQEEQVPGQEDPICDPIPGQEEQVPGQDPICDPKPENGQMPEQKS